MALAVPLPRNGIGVRDYGWLCDVHLLRMKYTAQDGGRLSAGSYFYITPTESLAGGTACAFGNGGRVTMSQCHNVTSRRR